LEIEDKLFFLGGSMIQFDEKLLRIEQMTKDVNNMMKVINV